MAFQSHSRCKRLAFVLCAVLLPAGCGPFSSTAGDEGAWPFLADASSERGGGADLSDSSAPSSGTSYSADAVTGSEGRGSGESIPPASASGDPSASGTGTSASGDPSGSGTGIQSGLLTAGSFDDNLNMDVFRTFISDMQQRNAQGIPALNLGQQARITVQNEAGQPMAGAVVTVAAGDPAAQTELLATLPVGTDGRAVFLSGLDAPGRDAASQFVLSVQAPGASDAVTVTASMADLDWTVTLPGTENAATPEQLDLAFVIDCTGSMSDELEYIKAEVSDIANTIADRFPAVALRFGLVCYRDQGDQYVTRDFEFTTSLPDFQSNLARQSAAGGGDYPEAVHVALDVAGTLGWTPGPAARVLFWIADAPPHAEFAQAALDKILSLRKDGVRIYPIGASGVADESEFIMRTAALLTGAEYIFLTDDSGVGNAHAVPHIPCYFVQHLREVIIRHVASELAGQRLYPSQEDALRTVGHPVHGVCTTP